MKKRIITFSQAAKKEVLAAFNMKVNPETGCIVEQNTPSRNVLTPDGQVVEFANFAGFKKGSIEVIKSDITSLIKLSDALKQ